MSEKTSSSISRLSLLGHEILSNTSLVHDPSIPLNQAVLMGKMAASMLATGQINNVVANKLATNNSSCLHMVANMLATNQLGTYKTEQVHVHISRVCSPPC